MGQLRLLCDTNPMCYGSSSALLAILSHLKVNCTILVNELTNEIIGTDPCNYSRIFVKLKDPSDIEKKVNFRDFDAVLVISNRSNLDLYLDHKLPLFFVDILYWYKTKKNNWVRDKAIKCFIEDFPGVDERLNKEHIGKTKPLKIGPLIRTEINNSIKKKSSSSILVNIGGAKSRWVSPGVNSNYLRLVIEILLSIRNDLSGSKILVAGGKNAISTVEKESLPHNFSLSTFPQIEFLKILRDCHIFISSPGLNAIFEGLNYNKPIILLPPQNASQVLQLDIFEKYGLVQKGLNFPDLVNGFNIPTHYLDERDLTYKVLKGLYVIEKDYSIKLKIKNNILHQLSNIKTSQYLNSQRNFKKKFWPPGAKTIADYINIWWN